MRELRQGKTGDTICNGLGAKTQVAFYSEAGDQLVDGRL